MASITDGTANVLLVAEKWLNINNTSSGDWHDDQGWIDGWDPDIVRYTGFQPIKDAPSSPYGWEGYQFGSRHMSGINGVMVDGSVQLFTFAINPTTFNNLGNRSDGGSATLED
jgi:prepilin-type processing-associated H-X9-DG protein